MKPIAFKVRGGGNYSGTKGGAVRPNEKGGAGYLGYEDKTFTISTSPDQWILAPMKPIISPTITTCKGSRGGCSDEAIEEIKAVQAAREQQHLLTQPITNPMNEPAQPPLVGKPLRYLSVCSGMEAASVAWHPLGFKPVAFSEIEPFPSAILKHHFTQPNYPYDVPNLGSLTEYKQWPLEPGAIDLLVGGTPCQSFSVAGLRKGLDDPRGNLCLSFLGIADKLKSRWLVFENVPGLLSSNGGKDFGSFLGALVELGYGFAYRVLDAQHFGVPQRRRRVFVVACLGDWRAPAEVLLESDCVRRDIKKGRAKGQGVAADAEGGVGANGRKWPADTACTLNAAFGQKLGLEDQHALGGASLFVMSSGQANAAIAQDMAHTLNATHETQTVAMPVVIDRAAFNQGVNAQYEPHIAESEVMDSLVARGPHAVGQPIPIQDGREMEKNQNGMGIAKEGDPAYTIDTTGAQAVGQPIAFRKSKRACSTTDNETWVEADASNTLNNFDLGDTRTTRAVVGPICCNTGPNGNDAGNFACNQAVDAGHILPVVEPFAWTQNQREEVRILGDKTGALALPGTHQNNYIAEHIAHCSEVAPTVTSSGPPYSRTTHAVVEPIAFTTEQTPKFNHDQALTLTKQSPTGGGQPQCVCHCSDVAPTVTSSGPPYSRTGNERVEAEALAVTFQPDNLRRDAGADPSTTTTTTLKASAGDQMPHICYPLKDPNDIACAEHRRQNGIGNDGDPAFTLRTAVTPGIATAMAVRRLTPVECERLQGFPDNWSRISWKGKPASECPDGPRYKACGNSMAVPVMRWIGERIAEADAKYFPNA